MLERRYRYYALIVTAFVTVMLCANPIGAAKAAQLDLPWVGTVTFVAGVLLQPPAPGAFNTQLQGGVS